MKDETQLRICVLVSNMFVLAAFICLAIIFGKWWIALFSAFFFDKVKITRRMWCDGCGEVIYGASLQELSNEAKRRGWKKIKHDGQFLDACPNCYEAMLKKEGGDRPHEGAEA